MASSYPYLRLAQRYDIPYGTLLHYVEARDTDTTKWNHWHWQSFRYINNLFRYEESPDNAWSHLDSHIEAIQFQVNKGFPYA